MSKEILTEDEKKRVADLARSEAIYKMKLNPKFRSLPSKKRCELIRGWEKK